MLVAAVSLLLLGVLLAGSNWRLGIFATVFMAFLQDPLRKITPDQPAVFILFSAIVFCAALARSVATGMPATPNAIPVWATYMRAPFRIFLLILFLQAAHSLARFGNPLIPALGLIEYLAPFVGVVLAYRFAVTGGTRKIRGFLWFYLALALPALCTVGLEASGIDWPIFGEVGTGIHISGFGGRLIAHSGTFRSSEIAGWHAATAACIVTILATQHRLAAGKLAIAAAVVILIVGLGILTGRRKFIAMIFVFICVYSVLVTVYVWRARDMAILIAAIGLSIYVVGPKFVNLETELDLAQTYASESDFERGIGREYDIYVQRAGSVFGDIGERMMELGIAPIGWAYVRFGLLGAGLGTGAQGARYVGAGPSGTGAAEGGLGKLMLDLGLPGLLISGFLVLALFRTVRAIMRLSGRRAASAGYLNCGLVALLATNAANFAVATQTYGDLFVLIFLGFCGGIVLAMPAVASRREGVPIQRSVFVSRSDTARGAKVNQCSRS